MPKYPVVNYIGNKEKIADCICDLLPSDSNSLFDAFSGGCSISYEAKIRGFQVYSNDVLEINFHIANALIKNKRISSEILKYLTFNTNWPSQIVD